MKNRFLAIWVLVVPALFSACGDDDYFSEPPTYSDIRLEHLNPEKQGYFHVGDTVLATALEKTKGRRIDKVNVSWSVMKGSRFNNSVGKFVYGTVHPNLTDTIVLNEAGGNRVTLSAKFRSMSADMRQYNEMYEDKDNKFKATYQTISFELYQAVLEKTFNVLP